MRVYVEEEGEIAIELLELASVQRLQRGGQRLAEELHGEFVE